MTGSGVIRHSDGRNANHAALIRPTRRPLRIGNPSNKNLERLQVILDHVPQDTWIGPMVSMSKPIAKIGQPSPVDIGFLGFHVDRNMP
jgi:hypothetical protein